MKFLIISFFLACASAQYVSPGSSLYHSQFLSDLYSKSVDLNQDGQPDVPVYPTAPALLPNYYPYAGLNYRTGFPYSYGAPFTYPFAQAPFTYPFAQAATAVVANAAPAKTTRAKRQVAVHKPSEFLNDFAYSSVDLNQDGQPDNAVYPAPFPTYTTPVAPFTGSRFVTPYTAPFTGYPGYFGQAYPFANGFLG
ncbi:uncharacterized protein LOC124328902 [Daphnia pulicaria]|uniref:uncharacterized protein LOC124328902 n=1 Tax=Daphnia pulicaria TaxID=35523 RepID=UPI001EEB87F1|nr:uncharacterized protein LOC124328902 [Daphnia pulicaria]